jgi:alpha-ketoglutarate-dependent taurine dioxygenase
MKITKINGLGSFGVYVDDFDYSSADAWKELEQVNLKYLITIVRGNGQDRWNDIAFGSRFVYRPRALPMTKLMEKYGRNWNNPDVLDEQDKLAHAHRPFMQIDEEVGRYAWTRISGERTDQGMVRGMFADTELLWHSNGSGDNCFSPLVMLYGKRSMMGSSTGFVVTADWLDEQTESFRSELEDLSIIHEWIPNAIEPTGPPEHEALLRSNFADWKPAEMPLIMTSPGGIKGVHIGAGTFTKFKDMSAEDSEKLITRLRKEIMCEKWTKDLWWEHDQGDLYLFDNSITLHNRTFEPGTNITEALQKRLGYRTSGDYLSKMDWEPSQMESWRSERAKRLEFHYAAADVTSAGVLRWLLQNESQSSIADFSKKLQEVIPATFEQVNKFQTSSPEEVWKEFYNKFDIQ